MKSRFERRSFVDGSTVPKVVRTLRWLALLLGIAVVCVLIVKILTWDWMAVGDFGTLRLRTLDVGTSHTPLVGIYSRWGWNHPGPMLFMFMAPALRLTGGAGHGLLLGALAINVAAIASVTAVAKRAGNEMLALVALGTIVLCRALGTGELLDPWNPYALILALFTAFIAGWRALLGDRVAAVVFVVAASFAVQCHVEVALTVILLAAVVLGALGVRAIRGRASKHDRMTLALALGVGFVCWLPPIIEQFTASDGGNLRAIASFALHGGGDVNGWHDGARIVSWFLASPFNWLGGDLLVPKGGISIPIALVALVGATAWAAHRRYLSELAVCAVALLGVVTAFVACSRISGVAFPYLYRWVLAVAVVVWIAIGAVALRELRERFEWAQWSEAVLWAITSVLLIITLAQGPNLTALKGSDTALRKFDSLVEPTLAALRELPPPTLLTVTASGVDGSFAIDMLQRAPDEGLDVRFDSERAFIFGTQRTIDPARANSELVLAEGASRDTYINDPRYQLVGEFDPLSPEERSEYERLDAIDWSARTDGPTNPGDEYRRYRQLAEDFEYLAVFVSDQPLAPTGG
ncbi:unannotated protein [freshwater metagenome]|uniref:Unannotated protein n=1 Tax=freshwater metagenome TaxID=449393 RepID=A0A6J5YCJ5_9ZZZZ